VAGLAGGDQTQMLDLFLSHGDTEGGAVTD
jgi:hypothetical protein